MTDQINSVFEPTDTQMLDWMISNEAFVNFYDGTYHIESVDSNGDFYKVGGTGLTGREAIKAAMLKANK